MSTWERKWNTKRRNPKSRGIFFLSLEEYIGLAKEAGLTDPNQIGRTNEKYCLGRIGDVGNYEIGNCRFITNLQNQKERKQNGGASRAGKKISENIKNNGLSELQVAAMKYQHSIATERLVKSRRVNYSFLSPDGVRYEGTNISEFCRKMGLKKSTMTGLHDGYVKIAKGWTL